MAVADKLNELVIQRDNLANNLNAKGVNASIDETLSTLVPKVLDIETGGGGTEVEKGLVINAFDSNGYVTEITLVGYTIIPSYAFYVYNASNADLLTKELANINIPCKITKIGSYAFYTLTQLKELVFYGDITSIGSYAFRICGRLTKIVFHDLTSVPSLGSNAFQNMPIGWLDEGAYVYVPDNLVESFKSATNWSAIASQIKGLSELEG